MYIEELTSKQRIEVGKKLKELISERFKQSEFAQKIGETQGNISAMLGGQRPLTEEKIALIAIGLGLTQSSINVIIEDAKSRILIPKSENRVNDDPLVSLAEKERLTPGQLEKVKSFIQFVKTQD